MAVLLRNSNGKVLKTDKGNALKANYSFGKSIVKNAQDFYVSFENLNVVNTLYVGAFISGLVNILNSHYVSLSIRFQSGYRLTIQGHNNNTRLGRTILWSDLNARVFDTAGIAAGAPYNYPTAGFLSFNINLVNKTINYYGTEWSLPLIDNDTINEIWIFRGPNFLNAVDRYSLSGTAFNRVILYNRQVSQVEQEYILNNFISREILSSSDLLVDTNCDAAEIDGSNITLKNKIGSLKGIIYGLPAGTLQEQIDYTNANLFVNF